MANENLTPRETPIGVGERAPEFALPNQDRQEISLSSLLDKGDVVLSFFPMAFTSVCTAEMGCFTKDLAKYKDHHATVVGISCDSFATLRAWAEAEKIEALLMADMHRKVCRAYGFYFAPLNVAGRGTIVIRGGSGADRGTVVWASARELGDAVKSSDVLAALA